MLNTSPDVSSNTSDRPDWLRLPEATRRYGVSRSSWYELIANGRVKTVVLKKKGNIRGIRLLSRVSIDALMESLQS